MKNKKGSDNKTAIILEINDVFGYFLKHIHATNIAGLANHGSAAVHINKPKIPVNNTAIESAQSTPVQ